MSLKMIAASNSNRRMGCKVTSQASSGVRQIVKKSYCLRVSLNSGKEVGINHILCARLRPQAANSPGRYLPACLITHTGVFSTCSPRAARKIKSFFKTGNCTGVDIFSRL